MAEQNHEVTQLNATFNTNLATHAPSYMDRMKDYTFSADFKGEENFFDSVGGITRMSKKTTRRGKVPLSSGTSYRRMGVTHSYESREVFDGFDKLFRHHNGIDAHEVKRHTAGARRVCDEVIIQAALGEVRIGKYGQTPVGFPTSQVIPHGNSGMTPQKIEDAITWFRRTNPQMRDQFPTLHTTTLQESDLLAFNENRSHDYDARYNLMNYTLPSKYGVLFNVIDDYLDFDNPVVDRNADGIADNDGTSGAFDPILPIRFETIGGKDWIVRTSIMMTPDAIGYGEVMPHKAVMSPGEHAGYSVGTTQVTTGMSVGAYRDHERKILLIEALEDPDSFVGRRFFGDL